MTLLLGKLFDLVTDERLNLSSQVEKFTSFLICFCNSPVRWYRTAHFP
jgi:hypothetical protein